MSDAARRLRERPCTCGRESTHWDPHHEGCPRHIDTSGAKRIAAALIRLRHSELDGEWINLTEWHRIDLFAFRLHREWTDAAFRKRTGIDVSHFHRRVGYEIKISRADFRAEIRNPRKRQTALSLTHQFFFATPANLVKKAEVPEECGLVYVHDDGTCSVGKRAPIRLPTRKLTTDDMVGLLVARHLGPRPYELRQRAFRAERQLAAARATADEAMVLLAHARAAMIQERGHLLVAGSEWIGPWPWPSKNWHRKRVDPDCRVVVTSVRVDEDYDDLGRREFLNAHNGTVYLRPVVDQYGSEWLDPGDFLMGYRPAEQQKLVVPDSSFGRLRAIDGGAEQNIEF